MPHFVKVNEQGFVKELWDSPPPVPVGTDGWRNAVFANQVFDQKKQKIGETIYDLNQDPVVISSQLIDYTVDERKEILISINSSDFDRIINAVGKAPSILTTEELRDIRSKASNNKTAIESCSTHQELDNLQLETISIF